jgi:hypothetical protein
MSTKFTGLINLTKCNNAKYLKSLKNGDKAVYVEIWLNDKADEFGNTMSVKISQTKEQREADGALYIGNAKPAAAFTQQQQPVPEPTPTDTAGKGDLPF